MSVVLTCLVSLLLKDNVRARNVHEVAEVTA
ncbi:hypothetical protein E2C01_062681 [Portunus trituberculatus]|uniref:Uncharacterized protein n=1 Tax=Portunus trituberculatus TaxID=210409 RepID=A0A5B7HFC7_PORTR|nr:hypothetical protein [Portunus trituberculatus]